LADDPRFSTIEARTRNIDQVYGWIDERMKTRTTAEWKERLDAADVPNGVVNDLMSVVREPYLAEVGFFQPVDHPTEGRLTTTPFPVSFSDTKLDHNRPTANLGEHTEAVLQELGYSEEEITAIRG
jgi:crotonobetainyl-CoA:carnitine CoA-transferase CaiB-like acyl-CoA transferase